jgi:hypothetical protein
MPALCSAQAGPLVVWGTTNPQLLNVPSGNFLTADGGSDFILGIREDQTLAAWGAASSVTNNVPSGTFKGVSSSLGYAVAIRTDGTLEAWGSPLFSSVLDVPSGSFVKVQTEEARCVGLRADGTIATWGQTEPAPIGQFIDVATGPFSGVAIRADGSLVSWGLLASFPVPSGSFVAVEAGGTTTGYGMAMRSDGTVQFWGNVFGDPSLMTGVIRKIRASGLYSFGLRDDGTLTHPFSSVPLPSGTFVEINTSHHLSVAVIPAPHSSAVFGAMLMLAFRRRPRA